MIRSEAFITPFWQTQLPENIDIQWLIDLAYQQKDEDNIINNCGGWQGFKYNQVGIFPIPQGLLLQEFIETEVNNILQELGIDWHQDLLNYWLNINPSGAHNESHKHGRARIVGNLYLEVPENSGELVLHRDDTAWYHVPNNLDNPCVAIKKMIMPKPRDIILFPGWVTHSVNLNKSSKDRISLSFNYGDL
jgi:uncharacterized protein (TIGR02466 family)